LVTWFANSAIEIIVALLSFVGMDRQTAE